MARLQSECGETEGFSWAGLSQENHPDDCRYVDSQQGEAFDFERLFSSTSSLGRVLSGLVSPCRFSGERLK